MTIDRLHHVSMPALICLALVTPSAHAQRAEDLQARVMREYPVALDRLAKHFSQVHGVVRRAKDQITNAGATPISVESKSFFLDGNSWKTTTIQTLGTGPYEKVTCQGPNVSFRVVTQTKGDKPMLTMLGADENQTLRKAREALERDLVAVPFNIGYPIAELLGQPGFKFDRVTEIERDGRKLLALSFTKQVAVVGPGGKPKCRLVISPDEGWVLREYEWKIPSQTRTMRVDYFPSTGGIPGIKNITRSDGYTLEAVEFEDFQFGPTPASEFTLKSVGLPDIEAQAPPREADKTSLWLIGSGCLAGKINGVSSDKWDKWCKG